MNVAAIKFRSQIQSLSTSDLDLDYVTITDPDIVIKAAAKSAAAKPPATAATEKTLKIGSLKIDNGLINFKSSQIRFLHQEHLSWLLTNFRWVLEVRNKQVFIVWIGFCEPQSE